MGVDFELPTVKDYLLRLLLLPELFLKILIILLSTAGIVLMVEFGFNDIQPSAFCNDDELEEGAFRFCINSIACNIVVILISSALISVDLFRACLSSKEWKRLAATFVIIIVIPLTGYLLASSSLVLQNYITFCDERSCLNIEQRRFLTIPIIGFIAAVFYLIIGFLSFIRVLFSRDD